jgi:hypothetical protein
VWHVSRSIDLCIAGIIIIIIIIIIVVIFHIRKYLPQWKLDGFEMSMTIQDPMLKGASVDITSKVRTTAMLLLLKLRS